MGALSKLLIEAEAAINELGKNSKENDGWDFKVDKDTWSVDDFTIRTSSEDFVLAVTWANPPEGYTPSMPNLGHVFEKLGWSVVDTAELERLRKVEEEYKKLKSSQNTFVSNDIHPPLNIETTVSFRVNGSERNYAEIPPK